MCQLSASMSQDAPTSTCTSTISASTTPASPYCFVSGHQRDRHLFAGIRGEDVEDWLDDYDRVSSANRWDDLSKLYVAFYLTGVAKTWFVPTNTPMVRSALTKKTLDTRKQQPGEYYTLYIEDVLALCRRVNTAMTESDRVRHILKGIGAITFNALAIKNPLLSLISSLLASALTNSNPYGCSQTPLHRLPPTTPRCEQ